MANENICPLHFECVKQDLQRIDENIVAADAAGVLMAMFDLCDKWAGLTIYARFEHQGAVYDVPLDVERTEGGTAYKCCIVPAEVTRYNGFHVSLFGDDGDGAVLTSKRITVPVQRSIDVDGMEPIPPTPSLLESFENKAQNAVDIANSVREDANNGMFNGAPFEIKKTYPTRADMEADAANLNTGDMVLISSTVEDPDNSALYVKTSAGTLSFLCDLSGSQGVRGAAATIALGSTTVARAWTNPSVTNAGTSSDAVFKFTLPASPSFSASAQTLAPGSAATVSAVQNMSTGTLNMVFGVPQGAKGDTGETGPGVETLTTTGTGSAYKVTSVTVGASPTNGARLMIIPHTTSSVLSPTLSVNNGTARPIKRRLSTDSGEFCDLTNLYVFKQGDAVEVMYDSGSGVWILVNNPKTAANDIEGVIPIAYGGTGATTAEGIILNLRRDLCDLIYPVGAIYISVQATSPSSLFGGTWVQVKDTFLLAAGSTYSAGTTGGESTHTLTVSEMPSHSHNITTNYGSGTTWARSGVQGGSAYEATTNTGGGAAHNNMPPYLAVYVWKRTA